MDFFFCGPSMDFENNERKIETKNIKKNLVPLLSSNVSNYHEFMTLKGN